MSFLRLVKRELIIFILFSLLAMNFFVHSALCLFGLHRTCPRCGGWGRDPATLGLTRCPMCSGDREVGIFMNDEHLEDSLSFIGLVIIIVSAILGAIIAEIKPRQESRKESPLLREYESDVRKYFPNCPICGSREIEVNLIPSGRDTLSCKDCGAVWHLYIGLMGLK